MAGYVVAEVEVTDPAVYEDYRKMVPATVARYGGKFLVRGGAVEVKEDGWQPKRLVVLEFPSLDQARKRYHCAARREGTRVQCKPTVYRQGIRRGRTEVAATRNAGASQTRS